MASVVEWLVGQVWSIGLVIFALGAGIYFSVITRFVQIRYVIEMIKLLKEGKSSKEGISSFQAFCLSLSGRVGIGNIAGVATAIAFGGPGAVFWMWVMALLGGASAFVESTLSQLYKTKVGNEYRGGTPYFIEKGLKMKWFAVLVAIVVTLSYGLLLPGIQSSSIAVGFENSSQISKYITGILLVALLGAIIFGGVKRAVFSNVAGVGEATYSSAAAEVSHPAKQGLVQAFSVYIDTIVVCTATALMILITGMYNVTPEGQKPIVQKMGNIEAGPVYTQQAVETIFPGFGPLFVSIAIFFFAFTTLLAYYYIAETTLIYLNHKFKWKWLKTVLKVVFLIMVYIGSVESASLLWNLGDLGIGSMAWLNLLAIILLTKPALKVLKDYEEQRKEGKDPVFNPKQAGIEGVEFWEEIYTQEERTAQGSVSTDNNLKL